MSKGLVYLIDDEENVLLSLKSGLEQEDFEVRPFSEAGEALAALRKEAPAVVVTDILMPATGGIEFIKRAKNILPELNFVIMTAHASLDTAIEALRLGVVDYLVKPFRMKELTDAILRAMGQTRLISQGSGKTTMQERYHFKNLITKDPRMIETFNLISRITKSDTTVLITGESGTGKEMVARSIHYNSKRKSQPFISINCAALPENLLESELFGYDKGAFTGATSTKQGLLEVADSGTFFLDEVGELPMALQAKLLRVLQERVIVHLGATREIPVNIRLVAATSKNLSKEIEEKHFREDLFYRLNVVPVTMPPLRERPNDIALFADHFLEVYAGRHGVNKRFKFDFAAMALLKNYKWPGNIRELENLTERIVALEEKETITVETLERLMGKKAFSSGLGKPIFNRDSADLNKAVENFERQLIEDALGKSNGKKSEAAKRLGITRENLRHKLKRYGFDK